MEHISGHATVTTINMINDPRVLITRGGREIYADDNVADSATDPVPPPYETD